MFYDTEVPADRADRAESSASETFTIEKAAGGAESSERDAAALGERALQGLNHACVNRSRDERGLCWGVVDY